MDKLSRTEGTPTKTDTVGADAQCDIDRDERIWDRKWDRNGSTVYAEISSGDHILSARRLLGMPLP